MNAIRTLDITFSFMGIVLLSPVFVVVVVLVKSGSAGPAFYKQTRIGKNGEPFRLYKFRTMRIGADQKGLLTIGGNDKRVTPIGLFLRKYKLDELPQLWNVLTGDMSLVGPRPEVEKYVNLYDQEQRKVLAVRPGITDMASIVYRNENELLAQSANPEQYYVSVIMPAKIRLNQHYISNQSIIAYLNIIFRTFITAIKGK